MVHEPDETSSLWNFRNSSPPPSSRSLQAAVPLKRPVPLMYPRHSVSCGLTKADPLPEQMDAPLPS